MASPTPTAAQPSAMRSILRTLRPTHAHTALTATLLLTGAAFLSKIISLVRVKYLLLVLGRSPAADAFNAMFQLPDLVAYFLIGGVASITFVTMLTRYRESGREAEGQEAFSVVFTTMSIVLTLAVLVAELLAPAYVRHAFPGFERDPAQFALCVHLTRIILPGQIFFFGGGMFGAVLIARRQFTLQAFAPLIYNLGQIIGGLLLFRYLGVSSIAWGALAGVILGPFLINGLGARRLGMHVRFRLDFRNEGLRYWVRQSLPLILGVSLVTVDIWIINYFASHLRGAVTLFTNAKQLFSVPQMIGQAAGAASLPFLASLFGKDNGIPFARSVNDSVGRIVVVSLLLAAFLAPMSGLAVDLYSRGGSFHRADADAMGLYFAIFSLSLPFWSSQAIYARAFYASGNTLVPMSASTAVVLGSLPIYALLFHRFGAVGLAWASDLGITIQALVFALLLHRRRLVPAAGLDYAELARTLLAAALSSGTLFAIRHSLPAQLGRWAELAILLATAALWAAICLAVLRLTGSALPALLVSKLQRRRRTVP
ncbi:lipid II flippase MurJ [Acidipila sp. EB88]|uniref:lipid II flippase MurJ n=1 Tax=Acidipila sp. EB88 TaxID=2305226 RepID=UPI000F5E6913|nr:lipid II flippase MurJ [Acidipila sp. EB88]RRA48331.1 virulence factor MviN [Acidipila sp. EB88]